MPFIPLHGEKNISELVAKIFPDLAPQEKKKAEVALRRANPQVISLSGLPRGTLLVVPKASDIRSKGRDETKEPVANIARIIAKGLGQYREQLKEASQKGLYEVQTTRAHLKDGKFKKTIEGQTELQEMVKKIEEAAGQREKEFNDLQTFATKDLEAAEKDLAKMLAQLS